MEVATTPLLAGTAMQRQIEIENRSRVLGESERIDELYDKVEKRQAASLPPLSHIVLPWIKPLASRIREAKAIGDGESPWDVNHIAFVQCYTMLGSERLAAIAIHETFNATLQHPEGVSATKLAALIWQATKAEMLLALARKYDRSQEDAELKLFPKIVGRWRKATPKQVLACKKMADKVPEVAGPISDINRKFRAASMLMWAVSTTLVFKPDPEGKDVQAFRIGIRPGEKKQRVVWMDYQLQAMVHACLQHDASLHAKNLPMVAEPIEWGLRKRGGRYTIRKPLVVRATKKQRQHMRDNDMPTFYRGINWIANTKFSINKPIMQVIEEVWRGGRDMLEIPATKPLEKEDMPRASAEVVADKDAFMVHKRNVALLYKDSQGRKGQRSIFSGALNITKAYEDEAEFHFDQFCDFRGRVYPRGDYLNYTNEKWARAMLQFAKPVEPGEHGRRAARIWAANCYGVDKVSFADRERWTLDHSREIARCAALGLDEDFWQKADSPWEFLAACHALTDDQQLARLPIGRDGTANGLQHLAAMTRDETLAPLVNLTAGDAPADLYTVCLREVEKLLKEAGDIHVNKWVYAKRGHKKKVKYSVYVKDVLPWVKRSVCKQTFLAFAYGVTLSGAIYQVHSKMLKDGAEDCDDTHRIAMTLARACIQAIENIAKRPAAAMKWMQECARLVCNSGDKKTAMSWINGVNFLVEQPYRKKWKGRIQTIVGETHVQAEFDSYEVAVGRQVRGIAPNTVHSFDQEHLMRTACMMLRRGYEMFAQHDQYNCHAGHVAYMHREAIDQLAGMYEGVNRLAMLHEYWSKLVPGLELPQPPELGNFDPASIRESTYAFH